NTTCGLSVVPIKARHNIKAAGRRQKERVALTRAARGDTKLLGHNTMEISPGWNTVWYRITEVVVQALSY
ncbi:MAG: hypothetical protein ACRDBJ_02615, partial [Plesiomonas shigelloides]